MKKRIFKSRLVLIITLSHLLISSSVLAQTPEKISYQAIVRDANDNLVKNTDIGIQISILQTSESGASVYVETQISNTNSNGLLNIEIGGGTVVSGDFSTIDWLIDSYFIKTEVDPSGGVSYSITGTSQLLSVPYALHAKTVENDQVDDADSDTLNELQNLTLNGTILEISNGANADLSSLQDGTGTDNQTLSEVLIESTDAGANNITNLADPVNNQDAATKAYVDGLLERIELLEEKKIKDIDDNIYPTVQIGNQLWMAENLKVSRYADGTPIPNVVGDAAWTLLGDNDTGKGYCYYEDDSVTYADTYGAFYTYAAAMNSAATSSANPSGVQGACPDNWHLPSDAEWTELIDYLGGMSVAGGELKETGITHWQSPNSGATNSSGFSAVPSGYRDHLFGFSSLFGFNNYWWSATQSDAGNALFYGVDYDNIASNRTSGEKSYGLSIRCVRD